MELGYQISVESLSVYAVYDWWQFLLELNSDCDTYKWSLQSDTGWGVFFPASNWLNNFDTVLLLVDPNLEPRTLRQLPPKVRLWVMRGVGGFLFYQAEEKIVKVREGFKKNDF